MNEKSYLLTASEDTIIRPLTPGQAALAFTNGQMLILMDESEILNYAKSRFEPFIAATIC